MSFRRTLALLVLSASLDASAAEPALFKELSWRLLGPFRGGRVLAVTGIPGEPEHFYFGSVNGGVWETRDAGRTWTPIFDAQPIGSIGAIAAAPSNPKILYVGTGEADMRSDIAQGDGMYKSTDGGATWSHVGLRDSQQIGKIVVHPKDPNRVLVAALGHPYGANAERGVFRSRDGGASWEKVLGPDSDTGAVDLAFEPGNPDVIYAALWQTRRTPWSIYPPSNGAGSGLFKSVDGGDHWTPIRGHGFPAKPGRIGVAVAPNRPSRVYAIVDADQGGMYRSDDAGASWTRTSDDSRIWGRGWYFGGVTVEPADADVVYSCNVNLYRSTDAGKTFVPVKGAPGGDDYHQMWIDPEHPERRMLGVDQGAVVSTNGGATWSSWYNQPTGQFYHVITDNRFPYWVYGSQQDSGSAGIPSRGAGWDGINISEFHEVTAGGEADNIAPDPNDPDIIYGGRVDKLDVRTRQTRSVDPTLADDALARRTWTLPLVFSRRDPKVLYFANQKVFRTDDGGNHWSAISPDLTREEPGIPPNLDAVTAANRPGPGTRHGVVYAIAPSRLADHDVWVGTDDGLIWRTRDEGEHWQNLTPAELTPWSKVGIIETSHFDAETAYVAIDRHRLDDFRPHILRTHDGGKSWQPIANGIPDGSFVNAVREDSVRRGLLFAGTEKGVYVSFDDGDHWQSLRMNMPATSVRDIDVNGNDVVIATHGRAFWVIDDISPLRQIAAESKVSTRLFVPSKAVRVRPAGFTGTPWPRDEPMAPNPPAGAYLDYVLDHDARGPVTLEILDASGALARRYSSADAVPAANPAKLRTAPEWFATPSTLSTTSGMHRFVWPLRYPAPPALAGARLTFGDGVWAPPGRYDAVLSVDGSSYRQPLEVVADPRVHFESASYAEQFAMAREVEALREPIAAALNEADAVLKDLAMREGLEGKLASQAAAVLGRAAAIVDVPPTKSGVNVWWVATTRTDGLRQLSASLEDLATAVDGADGPPSSDAKAGLARLRVPAEAAARSWMSFTAADLAKLDVALAKAGKKKVARE
ncbi:MAG: hypothetical protein WC538_00730 [Thermoanaerobaculia bacterium]|jgi:photosystem II stability/assembly factor-like uncharacterized protein